MVRTLQSTQPAAQASTSDTSANLHVGRGLKLEGKIESCDSLVIEGHVQAEIESGSLKISETGDVEGDARVGSAEIDGKFDGTLAVHGCLTITKSGVVSGKITYGELKVDRGGQIRGEIESRPEEATSDFAASDTRSSRPTEDAPSKPADTGTKVGLSIDLLDGEESTGPAPH